MIDVTIMTLDSQNHKFRVPDTFTILQLKEFIEEQVNITAVQQRLIFCGRVLSNGTKLADVGIDGKVMHLVQKVPSLSTTTSESSSSTRTNNINLSEQTTEFGLRTINISNASALFAASRFPPELLHAEELPSLSSTRNHENCNSGSLALDMIRKGNEILNRLEHPLLNPPQSSASNAEQYLEGSQQVEASSPSVPPESFMPELSASESSVPPLPTEPGVLNMSYEVDESFPNTVVVTFGGSSELISQVRNHMQANNIFSILPNASETSAESEVSNVPVRGSTNQSSAEPSSITVPSSASPEQHLRNDRQTSENRSTVNDRQRFGELIEELNKLNERLRPFYAMYCQLIVDDPRFDTTEGEHGSLRAQSIFDDVSEVMHCISHVYHSISDMRVAFNRAPPRSEVVFHSRPCLQESPILHSDHSVTTTSTAASSSTQQPTSTLTNTTGQYIPGVRAFRLDYGGGSETSNVSTSATETNANNNVSVNPNTESNNTPTETPQGVELMFDLTPGSIGIDSAEAAFINPTAPPATDIPATVSQPRYYMPNPFSTVADPALPADWVNQMIDIISSGVQNSFMSEQSLDSNSIPTPTQSLRVTPCTFGSLSQDLAREAASAHPTDIFAPFSSHHIEPNTRPILRGRRCARRTNRSTSSATSGNSTTDASSPTSPNEEKSSTS